MLGTKILTLNDQLITYQLINCALSCESWALGFKMWMIAVLVSDHKSADQQNTELGELFAVRFEL